MFIIIPVIIVSILLVFGCLIKWYPVFGARPAHSEQKEYAKLPYYKLDHFENLTETPQLTEGFTMGKVMLEFFKPHPGAKPYDNIPSIKTDLKKLDNDDNCLIWLGHSSYYFQWNGTKFLIDPVLSGNASPVPWTTKAFRGANEYKAEDFPEIDYLIISHDHYDHLDYKTILKLRGRVENVICGLGVQAHFIRWGYNKESIHQLSWGQSMSLKNGMKIYGEPARHFSGRAFKRNSSLWMSYVLQLGEQKIYIGGDSGYDFHFKEIGQTHGPFDLAILECGQYNVAWKYIHMFPDEVVQAAIDLNARSILPLHSSKFSLSTHNWKEPLTNVVASAKAKKIKVITPKIGELVSIPETTKEYVHWWESVR